MAPQPIRAVFLDAGNTLFCERRPRVAIYGTVARKYGARVDNATVELALQHATEDLPRSLNGNFRYSVAWFRAFNARVFGELGLSPSREEQAHLELVRRFEDPRTFRLFREVPKVLEELHALGLVVGVVSNWSERLSALLDRLGIADKVRFIICSAEIRAEKPERAIFERALFRAGVLAEEALHVGNDLEMDVRGALSAGMRAALVDRSGCFREPVDGVPVIPDLRGVLSLVAPASHVRNG